MNTHHTINYIELPATDLEVTKKFYSTVFGWQFTDWGPTYISFAGAGIDGGFDSTGETKPTSDGVLVILYSNNLEQTLQQVKDAGGAITKEIFEFPGGRRFHFMDPNGNELAVWSQ
jgi:predicted enzyme related to lactoylglutathione lyase